MKRHLIYLLFPALLLSGCISDKPFVEPQGGDLRTTLTLKVPAGGFKPVETRAMDDTDENTIRQVDVLVFEKASVSL